MCPLADPLCVKPRVRIFTLERMASLHSRLKESLVDATLRNAALASQCRRELCRVEREEHGACYVEAISVEGAQVILRRVKALEQGDDLVVLEEVERNDGPC